MRAVPGAPAAQPGLALTGHMQQLPQLPRGPWSEHSVHEPAQHGEHDGQ